MNFNFNNFAKQMHEKFAHNFQIEEVKNLLSLDESYLKDSPISTGNRLIIDKITFKGKKLTGENFLFSHEFVEGVNILIADNLKGKSSVFKVIRFALTGKKPNNIEKWIEQVLLIFRINNKTYTSYIDSSSRNLKAKLINGLVECYETAKDSEFIWEAKSLDDFAAKMKDFFFSQLSYYSLKWTQKDSRKDAIGLTESGTSWNTYFSSIYLESKDSYNLMFGAQEVKVFEMLLGLELTYPINRLKVKLDNIKSDQSLQDLKTNHRKISQKSQIKEITNQLYQKQSEYDALIEKQKKPTEMVDTSSLYLEYDRLTNILNNENKRIQEEQEKLIFLRKKSNSFQEAINKYRTSISELSKEKEKKEKKVIELTEYINTKMFFSNLDIQHCPNCNHKVSKEKVVLQKKNHTCSLCSEMIDTSDIDNSKDNIRVTIDEIKEIIFLYEKEIDKIQKLLIKKEESFIICQEDIDKINIQPNQDLEIIKKNIRVIEEQIIEIQKSTQQPVLDNQLINLLKEIGGLETQLESLSLTDTEFVFKHAAQIELLEHAVDLLKTLRLEAGKDLIIKLQTVMLSEVKRFGINNISEIKISENMEIRFKQLGEMKKFDNFVEGEQLRLKIAFYLSIMQLDITENFGRHVRFLIIDSPTKEEADDEYLDGLIKELQAINNLYKNELQILIGTANRSFENQFENQRIVEQGQYVF